MEEFTNIVLTAAFTIIGGMIVFVTGQIVSKFFIDPIQDLKKLLGEIRYSLIFYSREIHTPIGGNKDGRCDKAEEVLRKHSSDLYSKVAAIPCYNIVSKISCGFLPKRASTLEAAKWLRVLSISVHNDDRSKNSAVEEKIYALLGFGAVDE